MLPRAPECNSVVLERKEWEAALYLSHGHGSPSESDHRLQRKDWDTSYYTMVAERASKLHNLLGSHHRNDGEGGHITEVSSLKQKAEKEVGEDQVLASRTFWTAHFLLRKY